MKRAISLAILVLFIPFFALAQVGIGTITPNAQLDIKSTNQATPAANDGILIPKVDEFPSVDPVAAQDGMMLYVTGTGTAAKGFYYWDNASTTWTAFSTGTGEIDWYEEGTSTKPDDINDDIYTMGNVAIGKNFADVPLDILTTGNTGTNVEVTGSIIGFSYAGKFNNSRSGSGARIGVDINVNSSGGIAALTGIWSTVDETSHNASVRGIYNLVGGSTGTSEGLFNTMGGTRDGIRKGVYNYIHNGGRGDHYGVHNRLTASGSGNKYGTYSSILATAGGQHYGIYSEVLKAGGFAGYFLGSVSIGTSTTNNYILPGSRGTANQVLQTDATGNVFWVDETTVGSDEADWFEESTVVKPNDINDDIYTMGNVAIGKNTADRALDIEDGGVRVSKTITTGVATGIENSLVNNGGSFAIGIDNTLSGANASTNWGIRNTLTDTNAGSWIGLVNNIGGNGNGVHHGISNNVYGDGSGTHYGISSSLLGSGGGEQVGILSSINNTGDGNHTGLSSTLGGDGNGTQHGSRNIMTSSGNGTLVGASNLIDSGGSGDHYGTLNSINGSGTGLGTQYGSYQYMEAGDGSSADIFAVYNNMVSDSNGSQVAIFNSYANSGTGSHVGVRNDYNVTNSASSSGVFNNIFGSGNATLYGIENYISNSGNGIHYGVRSQLIGSGGGTKFGLAATIPNTAGGLHYGVYSNVVKSNSYAGYFLGRVAIGNTAATNYILPTTRGTVNQVMQTDAIGNVSWVDTSSLDDATTASNGLSLSTNDVRLGGSLTQNTTLTSGNFNLTHNLNGTGDFVVQDNGTNHFEVRDNGNTYFGGASYWYQTNTSGTQIASLFNVGNDGAFAINNNGVVQHFIYGNGTTVFNNQELDTDFQIGSDNVANMFYVDASTDKIGIGTNTPNTKLQVVGGTDASLASGSGYVVLGNVAGLNLVFDENEIMARNNGATSTLYLQNNGGAVFVGGAVVHTSDRRYKRDIEPLAYGLDEIMELNPKQYFWKDRGEQKQKSFGLIAQEVQPVIGNIVQEQDKENKTLAVNYTELIPILINGMKEQQKQIEELKELVKKLSEKD